MAIQGCYCTGCEILLTHHIMVYFTLVDVLSLILWEILEHSTNTLLQGNLIESLVTIY